MVSILSLLAVIIYLFVGCKNTSTNTSEVELTVFAASSMTEALTQITELYKEEVPEVTIVFNFDSSGTLKTQIEEGAECDVFISAASKQMDELDVSKDVKRNPKGQDFVLQELVR